MYGIYSPVWPEKAKALPASTHILDELFAYADKRYSMDSCSSHQNYI
jgi:hypothetical protein